MWTLRALRIASVITPVTPAWFGYGICRIAALLFFLFNVPNRRQVIDNLHHVTPGKRWISYRIDAYRVFKTVNSNYYDLLRFTTVDRDRFSEFMEVRGRENLDPSLECGKGVIILT